MYIALWFRSLPGLVINVSRLGTVDGGYEVVKAKSNRLKVEHPSNEVECFMYLITLEGLVHNGRTTLHVSSCATTTIS